MLNTPEPFQLHPARAWVKVYVGTLILAGKDLYLSDADVGGILCPHLGLNVMKGLKPAKTISHLIVG